MVSQPEISAEMAWGISEKSAKSFLNFGRCLWRSVLEISGVNLMGVRSICVRADLPKSLPVSKSGAFSRANTKTSWRE